MAKAAKTAKFIWRGQEIVTVEHLVDALSGIVLRGWEWEASLFLERYEEVVGKTAASKNVGYCLGYLPKDRMVAGLRLFKVEHPFFGSAEKAKRITPRQALLLGMQVAKANAFERGVVPKERMDKASP